MTLAYLTAGFPDLTESFVRREIEQVRALGVAICIFSLRPRPRRLEDPALLRFVGETVYSPWLSSRALLAAHLYFLTRTPGCYLSALWLAAYLALRQLRYPDMALKTLAIFPKTVYFARIMGTRGVTHAHAHFANHPTTAAMLVSRLLGIPFSFTGHAWDIFVKKNQVTLRDKLSRAESVVTCTQFNRAFLQAFCDQTTERKIAVCYHGLSMPDVRSRQREPDLIVAVGSLVPKKGFVHLVQACALLAARRIEFRCLIVGEGPERRTLEAAIERADLTNRVLLLGARPHRDVMELLARASVFVLPSVRAKDNSMDGIPNVILEAFSLETPVISTRLSGIPEVVQGGETGWLVPPEDEAALADAIHGVLRDPLANAALARRGRALVAEKFDLERNVRLFLAWILRNGLETGSGRSAAAREPCRTQRLP